MKSFVHRLQPFLVLAALLAVFFIFSMEASAGRQLLEQAADGGELGPDGVDMDNNHLYHGHGHHGHHHRFYRHGPQSHHHGHFGHGGRNHH